MAHEPTAAKAASTRLLWVALTSCAVVSCSAGGESGDRPAPAPAEDIGAARDAPPARAPTCRPTDFAASVPIQEASGAVYLAPVDGHPASIAIVGDSDTRGAMVEIDPRTGKVTRQASLPLDRAASDDLEGLSWRSGTLVGLTSSGYLRHWKRTATGWGLAVESYSISGKRRDGRHVCSSARLTNCGPNYEGLCLHQRASRRGGKRSQRDCVGFAASKARGTLTCLVERKSGRLSIDPSRTIAVAAPGILSGCHFAPGGDLLWAGGNLLGGGMVSAISGWESPESALIRPVGRLGRGFPEAIAVGPGGSLYRFSDMSTAPSLADRYNCE